MVKELIQFLPRNEKSLSSALPISLPASLPSGLPSPAVLLWPLLSLLLSSSCHSSLFIPSFFSLLLSFLFPSTAPASLPYLLLLLLYRFLNHLEPVCRAKGKLWRPVRQWQTRLQLLHPMKDMHEAHCRTTKVTRNMKNEALTIF